MISDSRSKNISLAPFTREFENCQKRVLGPRISPSLLLREVENSKMGFSVQEYLLCSFYGRSREFENYQKVTTWGGEFTILTYWVHYQWRTDHLKQGQDTQPYLHIAKIYSEKSQMSSEMLCFAYSNTLRWPHVLTNS